MVTRKKERKKERNLAVLITLIHIEVSGLVLKPQIPENYNGHKKERKKVKGKEAERLRCKSLENRQISEQMSHVMTKPVLPYANNKGADQPAHPRSLISVFVVRCLDSIIPLLAIAEISRP